MVKEKKVKEEVKEEVEVEHNDNPNVINKTGNVKFTEA